MKGLFKFSGILLFIFFVLYSILFIRPYKISGDSMDPVLQNNTIILIDTLLARIGFLKRSDIVVYSYNDEIRIKRIIGLSTEIITIKEGKVYTNNSLIYEPYLNLHLRTCAPGSCIDLKEKTYQVPEQSYFVLGDNRENSRDSRGCLDPLSCDEKYIYYINKGDIIGKYIIALPSFSE